MMMMMMIVMMLMIMIINNDDDDNNRSESYPSDPQYSEYIRRKNAAADQCSGSSSGYYSSGKEAGAGEPGYGDNYDKEKLGGTLGRSRTRSVSRDVEFTAHAHRRDRSLGPGLRPELRPELRPDYGPASGTLRRDRSRERGPPPQVSGY